jgi:hypothetical protein
MRLPGRAELEEGIIPAHLRDLGASTAICGPHRQPDGEEVIPPPQTTHNVPVNSFGSEEN